MSVRKKARAAPSVFHDLDLPDADELVVKSNLALKIGDIIDAKGLTQAAAGKLMGMDQPSVSAILHGRLTRFSVERLLRALIGLGQDIRIAVRPSRGERGRMQLVEGRQSA